ncbi:hypothetical protein QIA34_06800 (plasmid) [Borreliella yangtzensis]|uniref:Uncharacterized protein n=1 Tax=Borreliella yangtzensis TaxID=683292 RepID=A0ABR6PB58_9SPIR|nr:hypothetical protein [Borreliella yangtzensis]
MKFPKFFLKFKSSKNMEDNKEKPICEINPKEFIMISEHLMQTNSTTHKLLGIIMASGIPLTDLKNPKIKTPYNFNSNVLYYTLDNQVALKTHPLVDPNEIAQYIQNLNKSELLSISAGAINYVARNIFGFKINTKQLKIAYSLIVKSKDKLQPHNKYTLNPGNIRITENPCIQNLAEKVKYIKEFKPIRPHTMNLNTYRNSANKNTSTIANLIYDFFYEKESCKNLHNQKTQINAETKNLHNLKSYINVKLRSLGIKEFDTSKLQKRIFSKIFLID